MPRFFNTAGPCDPRFHYMLPPERRLPEVRRLIEQRLYFVVHAPRQSGKTTFFRTLAPALTAVGRYAALLASCEVAQAAGPNVERGIAALLDALRQSSLIHLPEELRPPPADPAVPAETRLLDLLSRWSRQCPRPVVLFLDEIDSLVDDVLISALRQIRSGYPERPASFPQSVALVGLRDVRDGTFSPFNIKACSVTLPNFTVEEVAELYDQHMVETEQLFTPEAKRLACELSGGHPWLVNALAEQAIAEEGSNLERFIEAGHIEAAKETLIRRWDTRMDSFIDYLREPRVRLVVEPLLAGEAFSPEVRDDDIQFVIDLGLVIPTRQGLAFANPVYREVLPRALTSGLKHSLRSP